MSTYKLARSPRAQLAAILGSIVLVVGVFIAAPNAQADAPAAHYSYRDSDCNYASHADPLNVRWSNIDWVGVKVGMEVYVPPFVPMLEAPRVPEIWKSNQYAYLDGTCRPAEYSGGYQRGPLVLPGIQKYKFHTRLFTTGPGEVSGDAHMERKRRTGTCGNAPGGWNDAVYRRYDGKSGFDAAMDRIVAGYKRYSSSQIRVIKSRSPFTHLLKQCTGEIVDWSGRVAFIYRPGP